MKDLNQYVEELLYKHQCVIIPKFGAFISNRKSARLFEDKTFAPPKRELTFNASLNSNDGLLMKHIASTSNTDYATVENFVNSTVENWKKALGQGSGLNLPNIGTLRQTPEGRISFEPQEEANFLTDSFGMSSFVAHEVKQTPSFKTPDNQSVTGSNSFAKQDFEPVRKPQPPIPSFGQTPTPPPATPQRTRIVEGETGTFGQKTPPPPAATPPRKRIVEGEVSTFKQEDAVIQENPIPVEPAPQAEEKTETKNKKEKKQTDEKSKKSRSFLKYTAVAVIGLGLLTYGAISFFGEPVENNDVQNPEAVAIEESQIDEKVQQKLSEATFFEVPVKLSSISLDIAKVKSLSSPKKGTVEPAKTETVDEKPKKEVVAEKPKKEEKVEAPKKESVAAPSAVKTASASSSIGKKYQVRAGVFGNQVNANKLVDKLQKAGFPNAAIIGTNDKGLYIVSYGGFDDKKDADALKEQVKSKNLDGIVVTMP